MPYRLATAQCVADIESRANGGTQTPDLLITNQLLYHLSYISAVHLRERVTRKEIYQSFFAMSIDIFVLKRVHSDKHFISLKNIASLRRII